MEKPYVFIHTHTSIDGKINSMDSPKWKSTTRQYLELSLNPEKSILDVNGYLNGRKTTVDNRSEQIEPYLDEILLWVLSQTVTLICQVYLKQQNLIQPLNPLHFR